jgi:hypothetical protein
MALEPRGGGFSAEVDSSAQLRRLLKAARASGGRLVLFGSIGLILGAFVATLLPDLYESRTLLLLREREMIDDSSLLRAIEDKPLTVKEAALAEELRSFLFINSVLRKSDWPEYEAIVQRRERGDRTADADLLELVDKARDEKHWKVTMNSAASGELQVGLKFKWFDPEKAYRFVREARQFWIASRDDEYKKYFRRQLAEAEKVLETRTKEFDAAARSLEEFERQNDVVLLQDDNTIYRLRGELLGEQSSDVEVQVRTLDEKKAKTPQTLTLGSNTPNPEYVAAQNALTSAQEQLATLLDKLTPTHPSVEEQRTKTEKAREAFEKVKDKPTVSSGNSEVTNEEYTAIVESLAELGPQLEGLRMRALTLEQQINELQGQIEKQPVLQGTLKRFNNEYLLKQEELNRARLAIAPLRDKVSRWERGASGLFPDPSAELEASGAIAFLEEPVVPNKPEGLPKVVVALIGLLVGLGAGFALTLLREMTRQTFEEAAEIQGALQLPVLAAIGRIETEAERTRARVRTTISVAGSMLFVGALATLVTVAIQWPHKLPPAMQEQLKSLKALLQ